MVLNSGLNVRVFGVSCVSSAPTRKALGFSFTKGEGPRRKNCAGLRVGALTPSGVTCL